VVIVIICVRFWGEIQGECVMWFILRKSICDIVGALEILEQEEMVRFKWSQLPVLLLLCPTSEWNYMMMLR
jgi:hypothetical protein